MSLACLVIAGCVARTGDRTLGRTGYDRLYRIEPVAKGPLESVGIAESLPLKMDHVAAEAISSGATPGMAVAVLRRGKVVWTQSYGHVDWSAGARPVTDSTLYDLASLTKPLVTVTLAMQLVAEGKLSLSDKVADRIPLWPRLGDQGRITVGHLLRHRAGFPAGSPSLERASSRNDLARRIAALPLVSPPGEVERYSDASMLLLGLIVESMRGAPLDELFEKRVSQPLGLTEMTYTPLRVGIVASRIAPTEKLSERGHIRGEVHDPIAYRLGGVAGHAGLFGSIRDVATLAASIQSHQVPGVCAGVSRAFQTRISATDRFTLGWDTPSDDMQSSAGEYFSSSSFGHTGYTGTSLWFDPVREVGVILLTNRVNPSASNQKHKELRRRVSDAVQAALLDVEVMPRVTWIDGKALPVGPAPVISLSGLGPTCGG